MKRTILTLALVVATGGTVWAETMPDNVAFVDGAVAESLSGAPGDPANGRALMNKGSGNCIACHNAQAIVEFGFPGNIGPELDGVADRWTEAELRGIVANAKIMFEGSMMPSFYKSTGFIRPGDGYTGKGAAEPRPPLLTAQEVEDVVSYLLTLKE
ncbi:MAG: sulfur oxidation c-type cytochrome SoxX [Paracoccaceae bacterium]